MGQQRDPHELREIAGWFERLLAWLTPASEWQEVPVTSGILEIALGIHAIILAGITFVGERSTHTTPVGVRALFVIIWLVSCLAFLMLYSTHLVQKGVVPERMTPGEAFFLLGRTPYGWLVIVLYVFEFTMLVLMSS